MWVDIFCLVERVEGVWGRQPATKLFTRNFIKTINHAVGKRHNKGGDNVAVDVGDVTSS